MTASSPFERTARQLDYDASLPTDNWRQRRIEGIRHHEIGISAVGAALFSMRNVILDGRISTDYVVENEPLAIDSTDPLKELGRVSIGILPTGIPRAWSEGTFRIWSPDTALMVAASLEDAYDYSGNSKPQPKGEVGLTVHARTWGRLAPEEKAIIDEVPGAWSEYGDNGFARRGTTVVIRRKAGEPLVQDEVETMLAPLAGHVVRYFDILNMVNPGTRQPAGNFSSRTGQRTTAASAQYLPEHSIFSTNR